MGGDVMYKHGGLLAVLLIGWVVGAQAAPLKLYVAPGGNDRASGRRADAKGTDGPFASIAHARDAVRELKAQGKLPAEGVVVELKGGVYPLSAPLQFGAEDSGTAQAPVVYRAREGEDVRIIGGRVVTGWKPVTDAAVLAKLDPAARGKVLQANLKAVGIADYGKMESAATWAQSDAGLEFFFAGRPMTLARWPNEGYTHIADVSHVDGKVVYDYLGSHTGQFYYEGDRPSRWAGEKDIMVHGFWSLDWADQYYRIETLDPVKHEITLAKPNTHAFGFRKDAIYYAYNILSELDQPGEWYLDRDTGVLYFWPPSPMNRSLAIVSTLPGLLTTEKASHITFHRLTFEATRGNALTIKGGTGVRFEACTIRNVGSWAAKLDGCDHSGFFGCDISDTGDGGVALGGGDRQTLTPGENYVENCHLYRYGRWNPMYKPGISLTGVGQRVTHCLFNDGPHSAILFEGNDHLVEYNEFQSVVYHANDAGAIYAYHDWTFRGLVVRYNYFHDLYGGDGKGCNAVFFDNVISGNTIYGNVFANIRSKPNSAAAVFISGGRDNTVENNVFYNCDRAVYITSCLAWPGSKPELTRKLNEFKYQEGPWFAHYPQLSTLLDDSPELARHNVVARNVRWGSGTWISLVNNAAPGTTVADNVTDEDPLLVAPDRGDFRLKPNSPALKMGFRPIPLEKIGLYKDALRATWPVKAPIRPIPPLPESSQPKATNMPPLHALKMAKAPEIDGTLSAGEWPGTPVEMKQTPDRKPIAGAAANAWVGHDDTTLYVAVSMPIKDPAKVNREGKQGVADEAEVVFRDASGAKPGPTFSVIGMAGGKHEVSGFTNAPGWVNQAVGEQSKFAAKIEGDRWTGEWAIPLAAAGIAVRPGLKLGFNIGSFRSESNEWIIWIGALASTLELDGGGYLILD